MSDLQNIEAEAALLGALMIEPRFVDGMADTLRPEDFGEAVHGRIFETIIREHASGKSVSPVALRPFFENDPDMAEIGGPAYLYQLTGSHAAVIGARDFVEQIRDLASRRRLIDGLQAAIASAQDYETPLDEIVETADTALNTARDTEVDRGEFSAGEALDLVIGGFDEKVTGALCGTVPSIDRLLGPMRPTHLVIGAGRPGMGKTATAISYVLGAAERGHGCLFISLEMGAEQLAERMAADLCLESRIPYEAIRDRRLDSAQRMEVCRARERIKAMPLQILDKSSLTIEQVKRLVRRWKRRFEARGQKLELVVVDYLQLLSAGRGLDRYAAVTEISRSLKQIAKENGVAVLALSQLSREVEKRADKRPQLSDLRESGQIEQDADAVLFFMRAEYYLAAMEPDPSGAEHAEWQARMDRCRGRIEFICAKRRNGEAGSRVGEFLGAFQAVRG